MQLFACPWRFALAATFHKPFNSARTPSASTVWGTMDAFENISQWNQSIYEVVTCSRIRILRFFFFKVLQSGVFFFNKHLHCHVCVYFDLILKLLSHKKILIFFVGSVFVKTCDEHVIANLQRYRKAYNIIIFLFLMENSIVKIFGSLDVKITPDFCSKAPL